MISTERIAELRSEVGEDDFAEIVALFLSEADAMLTDLAGTRDPAEAEALLHALKGCALNLGFAELARLCRDGGGAEAGGPDWPARIARLGEVYAQSRDRLAALG